MSPDPTQPSTFDQVAQTLSMFTSPTASLFHYFQSSRLPSSSYSLVVIGPTEQPGLFLLAAMTLPRIAE